MFPSGSKRKRATVTGRAYMLNLRTPFAIGQVGHVQLVVAKDRGGVFKRGDIAAEVTLDATSEPYEWRVEPPHESDSYDAGRPRRTAADRVLVVLSGATAAMTAHDVWRIANEPAAGLLSTGRRAGESPLTLKTVQNTLTRLGGVVRRRDVPGNKPSLWSLERPNDLSIPESVPNLDGGGEQ